MNIEYHTPLMVQRVSERVDPWLLAEKSASIEGQYALRALPRLAPLLMDADGNVYFRLSFRKDRKNRVVVDSRISAQLYVQCQRCLDAMPLVVDADICFAVVQGPLEAEQLPKRLEPLLLEDNAPLVVRDLIEDELLLSIPASPRHDAVCGQVADFSSRAEPLSKDNPFAILARLKTGEHNS